MVQNLARQMWGPILAGSAGWSHRDMRDWALTPEILHWLLHRPDSLISPISLSLTSRGGRFARARLATLSWWVEAIEAS